MSLSQRMCVDDVSCATVKCAQHEKNVRLCHAYEVCFLHKEVAVHVFSKKKNVASKQISETQR